jgi:hypothetical protein
MPPLRPQRPQSYSLDLSHSHVHVNLRAQFDVNVQSTTPVPEPASGTLLIGGLLLLVIIARHKRVGMSPLSWLNPD